MLIKEITNLGKNIERYQDKAGMDGAAFASAKDELCRIASNLEGVRER